MIRVHEREFERLKEKETIVNEIKEKSTIRERVNFIMSHVMIGAGIVIALISRM